MENLSMKTTLTLLILLTLFSLNTFAQDFPPHTVLERNIEGFQFSFHDQTLIGWRGHEINLWDIATGTRKTTLKADGEVRSVSFSFDGKTLASVSGRAIQLWDIATGTRKTIDKGNWNSVLFSPVDQILLASERNGKIRLWNVATDLPKVTFEGEGSSVSFSPDGKTLASTDYEKINLWDVATGTHKETLKVRTDWIFNILFSPDGRTLAVETSTTTHLWDVETRTHKATLAGFGVFSPDGRTFAIGSGGTIHLWDVETGNPETTIDTLEGRTELITDQPPIAQPPIGKPPSFISITDSRVYTVVSFSPDGKTLVSATGALQFNDITGTDRDLWLTIDLWDVDTRSHKITLDEFKETGVYRLLFSPDGQRLTVITTVKTSDNSLSTILLWDFST